MRKIAVILWMYVIGNGIVFAQTIPYPPGSETLDVNDVAFRVNVGGDLSWDLFSDPGCEVPKGSGKHAMFAGGLWIGGLDGNGDLHTAATTYRQQGMDYWPGPQAQNYDAAYFNRYGKVWTARADEIVVHKLLYNQPGYVIPANIMNWPGNGDTANGEPAQLAPFFDQNLNGLYEPETGDYPLILGDEALYLVYGDYHFPNTETLGLPLGFEIRQMVYAKDTAQGNPLDQTIFMSYKMINRSGEDYKDVYVGLWIDGDLGNFFDDFVGTDEKSNMFYTYNGDPLDEGPTGYGLTPPAYGITFLNRRLDFMRTYNNNFTAAGNPTVPEHYYNYLKNLWQDSTFLTFGGNGYGGTVPTNFTYPDLPTDTSGWSEVTAGNMPSDRRMLGSFGPIGVPIGDTVCFNVALVFSRADSGDHLASVPLLTQNAIKVRSYYLQDGNACNLKVIGPDTTTQPVDTTTQPVDTTQQPVDTTQQPVDTTGVFISGLETRTGVRLSPNPVYNDLYVEVNVPYVEIQIMDIRGRVMLNRSWKEGKHTLSVEELPPGIYLSEIRSPRGREIVKWVKR
ncbi:MAG: T9SS type A sorting domain-containing protein [Bacteroidota bacterium]